MPDPTGLTVAGRLEPAWMPVFYNPLMELNRDLSVLALRSYLKLYSPRSSIIAVEPMAASGVRCLRYAVEVEGVEKVFCGDIDNLATSLIERNVALNDLWHKIFVQRREANELMYSLKRHMVPVLFADIDPYGSPSPFLSAAISLLGNRGLLAVTATDTAVLEGSRKRKALRRYGCNIEMIPQSREVALRCLIGYVARAAATLDKAVKPLFSVFLDYYVRLFLLVERSSSKAQRAIEEGIGFMSYCKSTSIATFSGECDGRLGPLWVGELFDLAFVEEMQRGLEGSRYLGSKERIEKLLSIVADEADLQMVPHQRLDAIASSLKRRTPKRDEALKALSEMGYKASRTHLHPAGIRVDRPMEIIRSLFSQ